MNYIGKIGSKLLEVTGLDLVKVDRPRLDSFGDYTSNVAWQYSKKKGVDVKKAAELIKQEFALDIVERVEIANDGFINFFLSKQTNLDTLLSVLRQKDTFGRNISLKNRKIVVEFTDPNPFKEFHVGHLYSNTVGESISRLLEVSGASIWRADYFGDVGMHVAKAVWGLMEKFKSDGLSMAMLAKKSLFERIEYLGQAYAKGATVYEEDGEGPKEDMKALNFLIFKAAQEVVLPEFGEKPQVDYDQYIKDSKFTYSQIRDIYKTGRSWSMEYFEVMYKRLGMGFNGYYPESRTGEYGYGMVLDGLKKGIFEKGEKGAIIFPGERHGLHNRVFINAMNLPTYETKDFGNAVAKYKDYPYDQSIIITGNEINEYFMVVLKALEMYRPELSRATKHIGHGMVRLPEGKMSSRTGKIIKGEWVLEEAKKRVLAIVQKSSSLKDASKEQKNEIAEIIAQGAVKYAFLKQGIGKNIAFDFDSSLSFEGNSGPYLQYTYARTQSVLGKAKSQPVYSKTLINDLSLEEEEEVVLRSLLHFPEIVQTASESFAPSVICTYLYDLSQKFNSFYNKHSILTNDSEEVVNFRLALTFAVGQVIKNGLYILGIKAPMRM